MGSFAHFLGKVWADRIAKTTKAKFDADMEILQSRNTAALEKFKAESDLAIREREAFVGISKEFYQKFFTQRVDTYLKLLEIKNKYISDMEEDFVTDLHEGSGQIYHSTYKSLRETIIARQIYISNDLDILFQKFRSEASEYIKEADLAEAYAYTDDEPPYNDAHLQAAYDKFIRETSEHMKNIMSQISDDISKFRSRIELDKS